MSTEKRSPEDGQDQQRRIEDLENRLAEAEETLRAIREGEVDAVVVSGPKGEQVFSLVGADSIYRLIVETMKEAAFTVTFDGKILFCNAQFGELVKRPMELVVGHPLHEFVDEKNRASATSLLLAAQRQPVKQRLVFQDLNCTDVPAYVSANTLDQPDGVSICVVAYDLTELENSTELIQQLRSQQEELRASEERFRSVLDNSLDCIYRVDLQTGRYAYISPSAERIVGFSPDEIASLNADAALAMIHPEDVPAMRQALARLGETGEAEVEYRQRTKKGDYRWLSNHLSLTRDSAGRPLYRDGSIHDITERKKAQDALAAAHRQIQSIIDNTPALVYACDLEARFVMANTALAALLKTTPTQMLGMRRQEFMPQADADAHEVNDREVIAAGRAVQLEEHSELPGRSITWLSTKFPLRDAEGRILAVAGIVTDVTERKRAEEALRQKSEELLRSNKELEYFNKMMVDRELRMIELKKEIDQLCRQFGQPARYS